MPKDFIWFDRKSKTEDGEFVPGRKGALSALGQAISGAAAPFLGDMDYAIKQAQLDQQRQQADLEYRKFIRGQSKPGIEELILASTNPDLYNSIYANSTRTGVTPPNSNNVIAPQVTPPTGQDSISGIPPDQLDTLYGTVGKKYLGQSRQDQLQQDVAKARELAPIKGLEKEYGLSAEYASKIEQSKSTAAYNYALVAGNMKDLSSRLVDAYKEGGAGDKYKSTLSNLYRKGYIPESVSNITGLKYPKTAGIFGKRFEIVGKMFPQITQQIGKEGSVRLVDSIFTKLDQSIPDTDTPKDATIHEMEASIESMFRIQKAFQGIDLSQFDVGSKKKATSFVNRMWDIKDGIELTPEEQEVLQATIDEATEPIRNYLKSPKSRIDDILRKRKKR